MQCVYRVCSGLCDWILKKTYSTRLRLEMNICTMSEVTIDYVVAFDKAACENNTKATDSWQIRQRLRV